MWVPIQQVVMLWPKLPYGLPKQRRARLAVCDSLSPGEIACSRTTEEVAEGLDGSHSLTPEEQLDYHSISPPHSQLLQCAWPGAFNSPQPGVTAGRVVSKGGGGFTMVFRSVLIRLSQPYRKTAQEISLQKKGNPLSGRPFGLPSDNCSQANQEWQ